MPEVKTELQAILGQGPGEEAHRLWMRLTDLADKMDWLIPVDVKGDMMEQAPEGLAGACSVKWPDAKEDEDLSDKVLKGYQCELDMRDLLKITTTVPLNERLLEITLFVCYRVSYQT